MPPSSERSPVQTQVALLAPEGGGQKGRVGVGGREASQRRIFARSEFGGMAGIELDWGADAHSVKKKSAEGLLVEEGGGAGLLVRRLHRSMSTPCPTLGCYSPGDGNLPVEIIGGVGGVSSRAKWMVREIAKAIECGVEPVAASGGLGGAYYFRNCQGDSMAILKPADEEPFAPNNPKGFVGKALGQLGLKKGIRVGETAVREVAAYLLDHAHFAKVPLTVLVKATHAIFHDNSKDGGGAMHRPKQKMASCQQYVPHDFDASDHGTSHFSVSAVHRIGILDIRILNTDRHAGNILVRKTSSSSSSSSTSWGFHHLNNSLELIPIDHGLSLPETLEDPYFEWLHWPQSSLPFSEEELDYIARLNPAEDVQMLRTELPMLGEACLRMLMLCTTFLKAAAASGLCLAEMGEMMSRECSNSGNAEGGAGAGGEMGMSEFEMLCLQAKLEVDQELAAVGKGSNQEEDYFEEVIADPCQFEMDQEDEEDEEEEEEEELVYDSLGLTVNGWGSSAAISPRRRLTGIVPSLKEQQAWPSSPKSAFRSPLATLREVPWQEEEEFDSASSEVETGTGTGTGTGTETETEMEGGRQGCFKYEDTASSWASPLRSISFSERKQRGPGHFEFGRVSGGRGVSAPEIQGEPGGSSRDRHVELSKMSEPEWRLFMEHVQELLEQALKSRRSQALSHRQRLGSSCQF